MNHDQHEVQRNRKLKFKANWVLAGFLAIAGFFLIVIPAIYALVKLFSIRSQSGVA